MVMTAIYIHQISSDLTAQKFWFSLNKVVKTLHQFFKEELHPSSDSVPRHVIGACTKNAEIMKCG